jgi:hypothetical protein
MRIFWRVASGVRIEDFLLTGATYRPVGMYVKQKLAFLEKLLRTDFSARNSLSEKRHM